MDYSACSVKESKESPKKLPESEIVADEMTRNGITIVKTIMSWTDLPGVDKKVACAIAGNFKQESGWNPKSNNNNVSYGIAQWAGGRLNNLIGFSERYFELGVQLEFLKKELSGSSVYMQMLTDMSSMTLEDATVLFCDRFERPSREYANKENRKRFAKEALKLVE